MALRLLGLLIIAIAYLSGFFMGMWYTRNQVPPQSTATIVVPTDIRLTITPTASVSATPKATKYVSPTVKRVTVSPTR